MVHGDGHSSKSGICVFEISLISWGGGNVAARTPMSEPKPHEKKGTIPNREYIIYFFEKVYL